MILSTDAAHSLSDSFDMSLGREPKPITTNLWGHEAELAHAMEVHWKLVGENKKLRIEIATLKSLARIERIAHEELGMEKPLPGQIILMK
ncbi:MAG: cell division protein FtsL [Promethearchaeota archaeon]